MSILGKGIATVCALMFIFTGAAALVLFNIEGKAFDSATYKQAFEEQKLYERIPRVLAIALTTVIESNTNNNPFLQELTVDEWEKSISALLPPQELKTLGDGALDATFEYLNGRTDSAVISLLPLKNRLAGESGVNFVREFLAAQPMCTVEQLTQIALGFLEGNILPCNPPPEAIGLFTPLIESQLQVMTLAFPDQLTLISSGRSGTPDDPRVKLGRARLFMALAPFLPLLFLIGITIFAVRSISDWLKWWGAPFFATGALSLLIALLGAPILAFIFQRVMETRASGLIPPILLSTMRESVGAVTREILNPVAVEGSILALSGLAMMIVAPFVVKRNRSN